MAVRKPVVIGPTGVQEQLQAGDTLAGAGAYSYTLSFSTPGSGTSPVVVGAVYLTSGSVILATSNALVGTAAGGTGTLQLRRNGTGALLSGASWAYTGTGVSNITLSGSVSVSVSDWYTAEIVGDSGATVPIAYGLSLNF